MENLHPLLNVGGKAKMGNYAGIPGSGPHGATCKHCSNLVTAGKAVTCGKFRTLTGRPGKAIDEYSAACRYYQHRQISLGTV